MKNIGIERVKNATVDNIASKGGLKLRKMIAPGVKWTIKKSAKKKFIVESYPDLEKGKPYIFAGVHTVTEDVATFLATIDRNAYVLWGTTDQLENNPRIIIVRFNGLAYVDRLDSASRSSAIPKMVKVIENGTSFFLFPEGALNNTENLLILELFSSIYEVAEKTGAEVVVGVPYNELERENIYVKYLEPYSMTKFTYEQAQLMIKHIQNRANKVLDLLIYDNHDCDLIKDKTSYLFELLSLLSRLLDLNNDKYLKIKEQNEANNEPNKPIYLEDVMDIKEWDSLLENVIFVAKNISLSVSEHHQKLVDELTEKVKCDYYRANYEGITHLTLDEYLNANLDAHIKADIQINAMKRIDYLLKLISQIKCRVALDSLRDKMATTMYQHMIQHGSRILRYELSPDWRIEEGLNPDFHMQWMEDRKKEYLHEEWTRDVWDEELGTYQCKEHATPAEIRESLDGVWENSTNTSSYGPVLSLRLEDDKYNFKKYMKENWNK